MMKGGARGAGRYRRDAVSCPSVRSAEKPSREFVSKGLRDSMARYSIRGTVLVGLVVGSMLGVVTEFLWRFDVPAVVTAQATRSP